MRNLVVKGVLLLVLVVGGLSALHLSRTSQDIRHKAAVEQEEKPLPTQKLSLSIELDSDRAQNSYQAGDKIYARVMLDTRHLPALTKFTIIYDPSILGEVSISSKISGYSQISHQLKQRPGQIEFEAAKRDDKNLVLSSNVELLAIEGRIIKPGSLKLEFVQNQTKVVNELNQDILLRARDLAIYIKK